MSERKYIFRFFIRTFFEELKASNELIDSIGLKFHAYLDSKLSEDQKREIIPETIYKLLISQSGKLVRTDHGFHPAYRVHFDQWLQKTLEQQKR